MVRTRIPALLALLVSMNAGAAVTASIDRADIELNESFTLELTTDGNIDLQPDISVLEQDFHVGQGNQLSNTTIINGQIRRSKTWTYVLMPKRAGEIAIPPIAIGQERSNPLVVDVSEPTYAPPGEADVFITTEVDHDETYVQAQVLLTIKIYAAVNVRQPALRDPTISGADVLIELVGDDRSYDAVIGGTAYRVIERVVAIYPQESGELQVSPARFEARVLRNGRITGRKVFESEALTVSVLPTPPPPADYPDATWLPARELTLSEDWSRDASSIQAGEPLTRHVTLSALGQLETQIPAIAPPTANGVNIYPDKPVLSRKIESGGIRGVRKDQYALIGVTGGTVVLPALEVPWWNIEKGRWQVARLPERSIVIVPSEEPEIVDSGPAEATDASPAQASPAAARMEGALWRTVSAVLGGAWLVTLLLWWLSAQPKRPPREPEPPPVYKQQARQLKAARKAALAGDTAAVRSAMIEWARLQWPANAPRSIGLIATRVSAPLADELRALSRLSYGPESHSWNGESFARALRSFAVVDDDVSDDDELLPPLMPAA